MSSAWSPMRSISVIIFSAADICLKSLATGCCCKRSFKHRLSMSRSIWSVSAAMAATFSACSRLPSSKALEAREMASSHSAPICISSLFIRASCSSNRFLIIQTSP